MKLSENQRAVLAMACTHGHLTQGCATRGDYGARTRTVYSLRKLGLLDVMDKPTELGRATHASGVSGSADQTKRSPDVDGGTP